MRREPLGSKYWLEKELGRGAMGQVWRGSRRVDGAPVAIKVLRPELSADPAIVTRFLRERSIMLALNHPCLVGVRDLVVEGDTLAIVMDLIDGPDLRRYLSRTATLSPSEALRLMGQVLAGLHAVHSAGILHRDLKPENILIDTSKAQGPVARLTDFGIARISDGTALTGIADLIGTPRYLAPETIDKGFLSAGSDLYAAGVVLYELLTGTPPFTAHHPAALLRQHLEQPPKRPEGLGEDLWAFLARLLEKDPANRIGSAAAAARECAALAQRYRDKSALTPAPGDEEAAERPTAAPLSPAAQAEVGSLDSVFEGFTNGSFRDQPEQPQRPAGVPIRRFTGPPLSAEDFRKPAATAVEPATPREATPVESTPVQSQSAEKLPIPGHYSGRSPRSKRLYVLVVTVLSLSLLVVLGMSISTAQDDVEPSEPRLAEAGSIEPSLEFPIVAEGGEVGAVGLDDPLESPSPSPTQSESRDTSLPKVSGQKAGTKLAATLVPPPPPSGTEVPTVTGSVCPFLRCDTPAPSSSPLEVLPLPDFTPSPQAQPDAPQAADRLPCTDEGSVQSETFSQRTRSTLYFINRSSQTIRTWWLDYAGARQPGDVIYRGESYSYPTFLTHPWVVTTEAGECLAIYRPVGKQSSAVITD